MARGEEWKRGDVDDTKAPRSENSGLRINDGHRIVPLAHFAFLFRPHLVSTSINHSRQEKTKFKLTSRRSVKSLDAVLFDRV